MFAQNFGDLRKFLILGATQILVQVVDILVRESAGLVAHHGVGSNEKAFNSARFLLPRGTRNHLNSGMHFFVRSRCCLRLGNQTSQANAHSIRGNYALFPQGFDAKKVFGSKSYARNHSPIERYYEGSC